ncbi:hypothetical protein LSAT2_003493 [Lamellibrachia satsuma]|nr:hypothetical protein LSAT2_003493 [Lamellibrachia satsuma]
MAGMSKLASKLSSRNSALFAFGVAALWLTARQFSRNKQHRKEIPIVIGDWPLVLLETPLGKQTTTSSPLFKTLSVFLTIESPTNTLALFLTPSITAAE